MNITYNGKTIDFVDGFINTDKIIISLSGGLDSAGLMYLLCKHFPTTEIIPINYRLSDNPFDSSCAQNICNWMKSEFPTVNIHDLQIFDIDITDETRMADAEAELGANPNRSSSVRGMLKVILMRENNIAFMANYPDNHMISGMTGNPSTKEMIDNGMFALAERYRDRGNSPKAQVIDLAYYPFINVDKKFVADLYVQNNLMETLYPLTHSCVTQPEYIVMGGNECGDCFWCNERAWAFNGQ